MAHFFKKCHMEGFHKDSSWRSECFRNCERSLASTYQGTGHYCRSGFSPVSSLWLRCHPCPFSASSTSYLGALLEARRAFRSLCCIWGGTEGHMQEGCKANWNNSARWPLPMTDDGILGDHQWVQVNCLERPEWANYHYRAHCPLGWPHSFQKVFPAGLSSRPSHKHHNQHSLGQSSHRNVHLCKHTHPYVQMYPFMYVYVRKQGVRWWEAERDGTTQGTDLTFHILPWFYCLQGQIKLFLSIWAKVMWLRNDSLVGPILLPQRQQKERNMDFEGA